MVGMAIGFVGLVSLLSYFLIAHTTLTKYIVPGYVAKSFHEDARLAQQQADSALAQLGMHERYLNSIKTILGGGVPSIEGITTLDSLGSVGVSLPSAGGEDLVLRGKVEEEDRFALKRSGPLGSGEIGFGLPPLNGAAIYSLRGTLG